MQLSIVLLHLLPLPLAISAVTAPPSRCCQITASASSPPYMDVGPGVQHDFDVAAAALCKDQLKSLPFSIRPSCTGVRTGVWYVVCDHATTPIDSGDLNGLHYDCKTTACDTCPPLPKGYVGP